MAFIDNLRLELGGKVPVTAVAFYTGFLFPWYSRKGDIALAFKHFQEGSVTLGVLGFFLSILRYWGEVSGPAHAPPVPDDGLRPRSTGGTSNPMAARGPASSGAVECDVPGEDPRVRSRAYGGSSSRSRRFPMETTSSWTYPSRR